MKNLILIGASGISLEIIDVVYDINKRKNEWKILGILDDDKKKVNTMHYRGVKILDQVNQIKKYISEDNYFLLSFCAVKNFLLREMYIERIKTLYPSIKFATIIHPSAFISPTASLSEGLFIASNVIIDSNASLGNHSIILFNSVVSRFVSLGNYCFLSASVNIVGNIKVGKSNYIGVKSTITKDIGNQILVNASSVVRKSISSNSIITDGGVKVINYKSAKVLRRMLESL